MINPSIYQALLDQSRGRDLQAPMAPSPSAAPAPSVPGMHQDGGSLYGALLAQSGQAQPSPSPSPTPVISDEAAQRLRGLPKNALPKAMF